MTFTLQIQSNTTETLTAYAVRQRVLRTQDEIRARLTPPIQVAWYDAHTRANGRAPSCDSALFTDRSNLDRSTTAYAVVARRRDIDNGHAISDALASDDATAMVGQYVDPANMSSRLADFLTDNDLKPCAECNEITGETYTVNGQELCPSCFDSGNYVFTEDTDEYVDADSAYAIVDRMGDIEYYADLPSDCESFPYWHYHSNAYFYADDASSHGLFWSEYSNEWVDEDTYYDEQREDDEEIKGVSEYHWHPYRHNGHFHNGYFWENSNKSNPAIGLEIEVNTDGDIYDALTSSDLDWILEKDASLDTGRGVEVISPPITVSEWSGVSETLGDAFREASCEGHNAGSGYGIHATVHRRHLTELQETRMAMFFEARCNSRFVDTIAQRRTLYSGSRNQSPAPKTRDVKTGKGASNDKFSALHFKGDLCECRIFRSNVRADRILKNVQFFAALIEWTSRESCTGTSYHWFAFTQWLCDPARAKKYSALYQYLDSQSADKFGGAI